MLISVNKENVSHKILAVLFFLFVFVQYRYFPLQPAPIYVVCLAISVILAYLNFSTKYLFVFYIFIGSYVLYPGVYFLFGLRIGGFPQFNYPVFLNKTLYLMAIFLCSLLFFYSKMVGASIISRLEFKSNNLIFYMQLVIMLLILMYGKTGESIFTARYGLNKVQSSTINEYFPMFYMLGIIYTGGNKYKLFLINIIMVFFCLKSLAMGSRGSTITLGLIYFVVFMEPKINKTVLILFIVLGFAFMESWAAIRGGGGFEDTVNIASNLFAAPEGHAGNAKGSNQTDVFYAANRIIGFADIGILDMKMRVLAFVFFLVSFIVPFSLLPPVANLSTYLSGDYGVLGGGLIFAYFYVWLSYFGVILIAYLINKLWNWLRTSTNQYLLVYGILSFGYMTGWYAYTPVALFKSCLWGLSYFFVMNIFHSALKGRSKPQLVNT